MKIIASIDGLRSGARFRRELLRKRLLGFKKRVLGSQIAEQKSFVGWGRRIFFAAGLLLPKGWQKNLGIFAAGTAGLILLFFGLRQMSLGLDLSKQILGTAATSFQDLQKGKLQDAVQQFELLTTQLQQTNEGLVAVLNALPAGLSADKFRSGSQHILNALKSAQNALAIFQSTRLTWDTGTNSSDQAFFQNLKASRQYLLAADQDLRSGLVDLGSLNLSLLPSDTAGYFSRARALLSQAEQGVKNVVSLQTFLLNLLGGENKTYLLVFENNGEMRATGGFLGTYGIMQFANGAIRIEKIESIYVPDGQLRDLIAAPGPLQRQESRYWGLRDSNWFADFPVSGKKMAEFLSREIGVSADGVIALTPDLFEQLLVLTGPLDMPEYGVTLTAANFREVAQAKTSRDYDRKLNEPKKFLADFTPRFLAKLQRLDPGQWIAALNIFSRMIDEKQILMFSFDPGLEAEIKNYGADGSLRATGGDYLAIYHSNVGGGKTDRHIQERVQKRVSVLSGGLAVVHLRVTRTHLGFDEKYFPKNLDFMRIFVPKSARLLSASGFDDAELLPSRLSGAATDPDLAAWDNSISRDALNHIYIGGESGLKFFANWQELSPGETKTVDLVYEVNFDPRLGYTQLLQKQPGGQPFELNLEIDYLPGRIAYFYPPSFQQDGKILRLSGKIAADSFYGIVGQ